MLLAQLFVPLAFALFGMVGCFVLVCLVLSQIRVGSCVAFGHLVFVLKVIDAVFVLYASIVSFKFFA